MPKKLNKTEKSLVEAIRSMLDDDAQLGLSHHGKNDKDDPNEWRGYEYLHNQIDSMFELKASDFTHAEAICRAFRKVHNYKYLDDPTFKTAMQKELVATAVPADERSKSLDLIAKIIDELKDGSADWCEKDSFNPNLDEIIDISKPEQPADFNIEDDDGLNDENVDWEFGDADAGHTPSD